MKAKRRRLPAEQAQTAILDAAERQLASGGPDGIRLQELADELGISHPAILHHFGSRAGLVRAVVKRALGRLQQELIDTLSQPVDPSMAQHLLERVFEVLHERGYARMLAWLYLARGDAAGDPIGHGTQLRIIAELVHSIRTKRVRHADPADTLYTVVLASLAMFGHAIAGTAMQRAGIQRDKFLPWLTRLLVDHLER